MPVLSSQAIAESMSKHPEWKIDRGELTRVFTFKDFGESMSFVNSVGSLAEVAGHHPDVDIRYNKVRLALISHDAGGLTEKDFALASQIELIL